MRETTTVTVKATEFNPGDITPGGSTVRGPLGWVKGGYKISVTKPDGTEGTIVFDGRRKYTVTRTVN